MYRDKDSTRKFAIASIWLGIIVLVIFALSVKGLSSPVNLMTFPEVPKEGLPVLVSFSIKNSGTAKVPYSFELFANGEKVFEGNTLVSPLSAKKYEYLYSTPLKLGDQVSFVVNVISPTETYQEVISVPPYHPHVWTSFVSFASFATSMAGITSSMGISSTTTTTIVTSMAYYDNAFGSNNALNVGVIFSIVLIAVLVHVEITEPYTGALNVLGRLRKRLNKLSAILFIIFLSMVFTQVAMILSWV